MSESQAPPELHEHRGAFGEDPFGRFAERVARFLGTPQYIVAQTIVVITWIVFNGFELFVRFDKYPFILLNLVFSTQAAYAAPLILLAQTRQADRDKVYATALEQHREEVAQTGLERERLLEDRAQELRALLDANTQLTAETKQFAEQVEDLTRQIHGRIFA